MNLEDEENIDEELKSHLVHNDKINDHQIEMINGDKAGSERFIVDNQYICHRNDKSVKGEYEYWECRSRRLTRCPFKMETALENNQRTIVYMYDPMTHTCVQLSVDIYKHRFRNKIKQRMKTDFTAKFGKVYDDAKKEILNSIENEELRENVQNSLPSATSIRSAAYAARVIPKAPKHLDDIDFDILESESLNVKNYLLASDEDEAIYVFGTKSLLQEFSNSVFKSCDATFKISPRLFYQVNYIIFC